jgi:cold shock protein
MSPKQPPPMVKGTVKVVKKDKGFGFLAGGDGREYFFHRSSVSDFDLIEPGVAVRFVVVESAKGPRAEQVELL